MITRPMLAATVEGATLDKIQWPVLATPKIDGIRCLMHPELGPVTRTFKSIPNEYVRESLQSMLGGSDLDGELYAIDETGAADFNRTQSALMSHKGQPAYRYAVFDCFQQPEMEYLKRTEQAHFNVKWVNHPNIIYLQYTVLNNIDEMVMYSEQCLTDGYEGIVVRSQGGTYKSGRSTLNQGGMLKYKPWADAEGTIVGFEELYHNDNEKKEDAFGNTKRSSHKNGKTAANTLGALIVQTVWGELRLGTGYDAATRKAIWERNQGVFMSKVAVASDLGRIVTFKYQKYGMQDLPRFPVFKGFRED